MLREAGRELKRHFWSVLSYMLSFACVVGTGQPLILKGVLVLLLQAPGEDPLTGG